MAAKKSLYMRNHQLVAVTTATGVTLVGPGGATVTLETDPSAFSRLLEVTARPAAPSAVEALVDRETLDALLEAGVLHRGAPDSLLGSVPDPAEKELGHLVVGLTGAVNTAHVMPLLTAL